MTFDRFIRFTILLAVTIALCASIVGRAHAGEYKQPPKAPSTPTTSIGVGSTSSAGQSQTQSNGQGQSQNAKGGKASATGGNGGGGGQGGTGGSSNVGAINASSGPSTASSSSGPASAKTGASTSQGGAVITDTNNSGNLNYREAANVVQPATMIIQGCQVQGQAGGANTRAAGMLGIGFTPKNCYDYIQAQAYLAIGSYQAACEVLNHTPAAERAAKAGAVLPVCVASVVAIATPVPQTYTREQVNEIVRKAISK